MVRRILNDWLPGAMFLLKNWIVILVLTCMRNAHYMHDVCFIVKNINHIFDVTALAVTSIDIK